MERRVFGATGLNVSPIGMGAIQITRLEWKQSLRVVREVLDLGVNWFDTARDYLDSELRLGEALRGVRQRVVLISKSAQKTPAELARQIDESLKRLGSDYLDVFLFHGGAALEEESFFAPGGLLETADCAVAAGKIRFLGFESFGGRCLAGGHGAGELHQPGVHRRGVHGAGQDGGGGRAGHEALRRREDG